MSMSVRTKKIKMLPIKVEKPPKEKAPTSTQTIFNKVSDTSTKILKFDTLTSSTQTVMVYTNIEFNLPKIFEQFKIYELTDIPLTKKRAHIDKKKIDAPLGSVVSLQYNGNVRGPDMRKKRPRCTTSTINHFLNQVTIEIAVREKREGRSSILNVMIFRDNFKIAGCRTFDDVSAVIKYLWGNHLKIFPETWKRKNNDCEEIHFLTDIVMRNVGFNLGFFIDREKLNILMNAPEFNKIVSKSQYEPTGQTNVNIQLFADTSRGEYVVFKYLPDSLTPIRDTWETNPYRSTIKAKKKPFVTLIVFSSSEIILSGSSTYAMRRAYDFFSELMLKKQDELEEILEF